jgi:hypothetical protein
MTKVGRRHRPYRQGGKPIADVPTEEIPEAAQNKSWQPGRPGQGGEGFSEGYGGSGDDSAGPSGPEKKSDRRGKSS